MYVRTGTGSSPSSFGKISYRLNSDLSNKLGDSTLFITNTETTLTTNNGYTATENCMVYLSLYTDTDNDYVVTLNGKTLARVRDFISKSSPSVYPLSVYMHTGDILKPSINDHVSIRSIIAFA